MRPAAAARPLQRRSVAAARSSRVDVLPCRAMKAVVVKQPGGPEVLELTEWPLPEPAPGWVRIKIRAFGLNRAEMFTRQGHSPDVAFPRILGIECAGEVDLAPGGELAPGQKVITAMGGLGRQLDGGYAEYTCVPVDNVVPVATE